VQNEQVIHLKFLLSYTQGPKHWQRSSFGSIWSAGDL
jgi:hypothetical protein